MTGILVIVLVGNLEKFGEGVKPELTPVADRLAGRGPNLHRGRDGTGSGNGRPQPSLRPSDHIAAKTVIDSIKYGFDVKDCLS